MASAIIVNDALALLSELVAFPTESLSPNRELIDWLADYLATYGASVEIIEGPTGRANLLATYGPARSGGLLLSAHTDVVPAGAGWTTPAYELSQVAHPEFGTVAAGRGTADMKGFIACALVVLRELDAKALTRPVRFAFSFDEEVGCVGVRGLLERLVAVGATPSDDPGRSSLQPDLVLIGEPSMMRPRHAHLGKVAYRLTFRATPGHSSLSPFLPSAIGCAVRTIAVLESIAEAHRGSAVRDAGGEAAADVTVNIGTIHGGSALNVLSELCELTFELRHTSGYDPDVLLAPFWEAVRSEEQRTTIPIEVEQTVGYPALATDPTNEFVRLVERVADRGRSVPIGFGTEGGLFAAALGAPVVICGPGDIAVAHKADEYVSLDQLQDCSVFLRSLIPAVCTR